MKKILFLFLILIFQNIAFSQNIVVEQVRLELSSRKEAKILIPKSEIKVGGDELAQKVIEQRQTPLIEQVKKAARERTAQSLFSPEIKAKRSKGEAMEFAAIQRGVERNPTPKERQNAKTFLSSNHKGKQVIVNGEPATVQNISFGKVGVKFADGTTKFVQPDQIKSKSVTDVDVLNHIENKAKAALQGKADLYGIKQEVTPQVSNPIDPIIEKPAIVKKTTTEPIINNATDQIVQESPVIPTQPKNPQNEMLKSRVYERVQQEYPEILKDDVRYEKLTLKDDISKATDLLEKDPNRLYEIANDFDNQNEVNSTIANIVLADKALREGNHGLYADLIKRRSLDLTKKGQDISAERASVNDNSTSKYVKQLLNERANQLSDTLKTADFKGMNKGEKLTKLLKDESTTLKQKINKSMDLKAAQDIFDRLKCV